MLPTISPEVLDNSGNAIAEDLQPLVDIPFGDAKVEDSPPLVVPPANAPQVVSPLLVHIDHQEQFTTKRKFLTLNDLLE